MTFYLDDEDYSLSTTESIHKSEYVSVGRPQALQSQSEWPTSTRIESLVGLIREANPQALKDVDDVNISMCQGVDSVVKEFDYDSVIGDIDLSSSVTLTYSPGEVQERCCSRR